jgi:hypothetical protein
LCGAGQTPWPIWLEKAALANQPFKRHMQVTLQNYHTCFYTTEERVAWEKMREKRWMRNGDHS